MSDTGAWIDDLAREQGLTVVEGDGAPVVGLSPDLNQTARLLGQVVARLDLFDLNGDLVYFDHEGKVRHMVPAVFRTWINDHVVIAAKFDKGDGKAIAGTLGRDDATAILSNLHFRRGVRPLLAINHVRLPVLRTDGTLEPLPVGYDAQTCTYTVPGGIDYDRSISYESAKVGLDRMDSQFPFTDERSRAVQRAGLLALFVKHLPGGNSLRPGFLWLANKAGTGKSALAKLCIYPVLGCAAVMKMKEGEQLDKELEAFIRARRSYIFMDNVYGGINSATIDQLLTAKRSAFRGMGGHDAIEVDNCALLLVSGNGLKVNEDAERRFLVVDLFEKGDPNDREVTERIDDDLMETEAWRRQMLSWLWALVAHWHAQGMPKGKIKRPSFEAYSELLGGIVVAAGYEEPFQKAIIPDALNPERQEFAELLDLVIAEMEGAQEKDFTLEDLARLARSASLFVDKVGTLEEGRKLTIKEDGLKGEDRALASDCGYLTPAQRSGWGKRVAKEAGQEPKSAKGVQVEFGKRRQARKATFTVRIIR